MNASPQPLFTAAQADFIRGPVSVLAASHDAQLTPNLSRAVGCTLDVEANNFVVFLAASRSAALLDDLRANRRIAVVLSRPSTHESLQIKADDAEVMALPMSARTLVDDYHARMIAETGALGLSLAAVQALFSVEPDDIVAVRCTPQAIFEQTPGPNAGNLLQAV